MTSGGPAVSLSEKLKQLSIIFPSESKPGGSYIPAKRVGNLIYVAGQVPMKDGKLVANGPVPSKCSIEQARVAARQCVLNALAAVNTLPGGIEQLVGVVRVGAFVSSDSSFTQQPQVANGASELLVELFGESGKHARAAVGVNTLPLDATVEIEFLFECK
jgi:enamine deaminase RidA (YjgF/YER057c/UK114 family)